MRQRAASGAWALCFALGGCGVPGGGGDAGAGVLLVVVDGLRADHLSALGYDRPTTPTLDLMAAEGVTFSETFAAAPLLQPSHASLLTGSDPFLARRFAPGEFEGLEERNWRIPAQVPHLAAEFLSAGWRTAAFVDDPLLDPVFGFGVGFQRYDLPDEEELASDGHARKLCARFLGWLRTLDRDASWFATVHLADLERSWAEPQSTWEEYFPARPELSDVPPVGSNDAVLFSVPYSRWRRGAHTLGEYEAAYDGHLRKLDDELRELFAGLRQIGRWREASVVVVGSFGVQFGEAGLLLRSGRYSMADLHVPWLIRPREDKLAPELRGRRVEALASLMDVAPTLLDFEGIARPLGMLGVSQVPWIVSAEHVTPLRRYAFASCGMQEGGVVIGTSHCLEYLIPDQIAEPALRRAWFGEEASSEHPIVRFYRFYDRRENPYPPLYERVGELRDENFVALRDAGNQRAERLRKAQIVLQRPRLAPEIDEAQRRELAELGYLGGER